MNTLQGKLARILKTGTVMVTGNYISWTIDGFRIATQRSSRDTAKIIAARLRDRAQHHDAR